MLKKLFCKVFTVAYNIIRFLGLNEKKALLHVSASTHISVDKTAKMKIGKNFRTRRNVEINIRDKASLDIGNSVFINSGCIVTVRECVSIGEGTILGPYVQIFDHDHERIDGIVQDNTYKTDPIQIGKHCWIGASSIILRGTELGDNCVIGAGSVVKGKFPDGSVIIQKR